MQKATRQLVDASVMLFDFRRVATAMTFSISPCCWRLHVEAMLRTINTPRTTQRMSRVESRRWHWKNTWLPSATRIHSTHGYPRRQGLHSVAARERDTLPPRLHPPLHIFNLSDRVMLADFEKAIRKSQAEQAWAIFKTLSCSEQENYIPLTLCSELYSLLTYARALAGNGKVSAYRQEQLEELTAYVEKAFDIQRDQFMASAEVRPIARHKLLLRAIRRKNMRIVWTIYEDMSRVDGGALVKDVTRNTYLKLLSLIQQDRRTDPQERMRRMNVVAKNHAGQPDNAITLTAKEILMLAKVYHQLDTGEKAAAYATMMESGDHASPDLVVEMVWRAVQFGEIGAALELIDRVEQRDDYDKRTIHHMAYVNLMNGYRQKQQYTQALEVFERFLQMEIPPTTRTFNAVLQVFAELGDAAKTASIYNNMLDMGHTPDAATFSEVIRGHASAGHLQAAIKYYHAMKNYDIQPNAYTFSILIEAFSVRNDVRNVVRWFQTMLNQGIAPNQVVIACVLKAFRRQSGAHPNIGQVVRHIVAHAVGSGVKADTALYTILLQLQAESGGIQHALDVHRDMLSRFVEPNTYTYTVLIDICGKNARPDTAQQIFDLMQEGSHPPNTITYCAIMDAWARANQLERVKTLAQEFEALAKKDTTGRLWVDGKVREYIHMFQSYT